MHSPDVFNKKTPAQMFPGEYCWISKNSYFEERLRMAASRETTSVLVQLQMPCYEQYDFCDLFLYVR